MDTIISLITNRHQWLYSLLIQLVICIVYAALLFYAAILITAGAQKIQGYFNGWITTTNDQLNYCFKK